VVAVLAARGIAVGGDDERARILDERDIGRLKRWLVAAATCAGIAEPVMASELD
jgi:hypothetical protein